MQDDFSGYNLDTKAALKFNNRLRSALHRLVEPVAGHAHFSLGISSNGNTDWLCRHDSCYCIQSSIHGDSSDGISLIPISRLGQPACQVILCKKGGETSLFPIVCSLVKEAADQVEMEFEDESLILELGTSWESLHTLYEISSDLRTSRNIPDILGRILDRIVAGRPNLRAILWIEKDGLLEPATVRQTETIEPRRMDQGLFGRAIASRIPIVINDRSKITLSSNLEPELAKACRIALVPIATRDRLSGLLETWQEDGSEEFDTQTIGLFEALALQAAMVLEGERAYHISLAEAKLRREFEIGGRIQETLLSGRPPTALPGIKIGVFTAPSHAIDGDFFDFLSCGEDCLDIFIGDVMGKGIPAALVGAEAKSDLLRAFGQLTAANLTRQLPAPKDIVTYVHQHFTSQLIDIESFISLYYVRFDLRHKQLDFVDCGHPRAIHYRADTETLEWLSGDNMPLGVIEGGTYSQVSVPFNPNDIFLFYSDGVTDAYNSSGIYFGEDRLIACVQKNTNLSPTDLCLKIREAVAEFTGTHTVTDDFTCLAVKIGTFTESTPSLHWSIEFLSHLEFLPALRSWIRGVCNCAGPNSGRAADALELAATETVSNIIRHGYKGQKNKKIIVEAQVFPDRVVVIISHWGKRFRPDPVPTKAPDTTREHGYGLYIVAKVVDRISYFDGPSSADCILLEKQLNSRTGGDNLMMVTKEKHGDVTVLHVALDTLDAGNEKRFKKEVISQLEPYSKVVLDLSEVNFIDSSGLGVILSCYRHLHSGSGDLKLCCLNEQVHTLFELVRMHRIFDIHKTVEEAVASFETAV